MNCSECGTESPEDARYHKKDNTAFHHFVLHDFSTSKLCDLFTAKECAGIPSVTVVRTWTCILILKSRCDRAL